MDEEIKNNDRGSSRGDAETRTQSDHSITSVARKGLGSTPSSTVGWGAVVACLGGLLYLSTQVDSKIDDRVDKKLDIVKAVYDKQFEYMGKDLDECKRDIKAIKDEKKSYNQPGRFDYTGRTK